MLTICLLQCNGQFRYLLMIAFANRLDPDLVRHYVRPGLGPNCLTYSDAIPMIIICFRVSLVCQVDLEPQVMQDNQDTQVGKERKENRLLEELESKELRLVTPLTCHWHRNSGLVTFL